MASRNDLFSSLLAFTVFLHYYLFTVEAFSTKGGIAFRHYRQNNGLFLFGNNKDSVMALVTAANNKQSKNDSEIITDDILALEKEVRSSTQAQMDSRALKTFLLEDQTLSYRSAIAPQWSIALASGIVSGGVVFLLGQNLILSLIASSGAFIVANKDPLAGEDPAGAIARIVGRKALESAEAARPKAKALARAAFTGEEEIMAYQFRIRELEDNLRSLEEENCQLRQWKNRRIWIDEVLAQYNLQELKDQARQNNLKVGGTKAELLMRLVEAEVIYLPDVDQKS